MLNGGDVTDVIDGDVYIFQDGWGEDCITDAAGPTACSLASSPLP